MTRRPHDPAMEAWQRLHDALACLGREIVAPFRALIVRVLDGLTEGLRRLGLDR